jgi:hypothetical protein
MVNKRYREVMALKKEYVAQMPESQRIFDFLEHHYPKLVNAVENSLVPLTNNTVELVICRFDQHYLELAGYDISQIPIARIVRGQLLDWPPETLAELLPSE